MKVGDLVLWKGDESSTGIIIKVEGGFKVVFLHSIRSYWFTEDDLILISTLDNKTKFGRVK